MSARKMVLVISQQQDSLIHIVVGVLMALQHPESPSQAPYRAVVSCGMPRPQTRFFKLAITQLKTNLNTRDKTEVNKQLQLSH